MLAVAGATDLQARSVGLEVPGNVSRTEAGVAAVWMIAQDSRLDTLREDLAQRVAAARADGTMFAGGYMATE